MLSNHTTTQAKELCIAAKNDNIDRIAELLQSGVQTNATFQKGSTALHYAAQAGSLRALFFLIQQGGDLNALTNNQQTPVHYLTPINHQKLKIFLSTYLPTVCNEGNLAMVQLFIQHGAEVTTSQKNSATSLYFAAQNGNLPIVQFLLQQKNIDKIIDLPVNSADATGSTPIMAACFNNYIEIVELLANKGADITKKTTHGETIFYIACAQGYVKIVNFLLSQKNINLIIDEPDNKEITPLLHTCEAGHLDVVKLLMKQNISLTKMGPYGISVGFSCLYFAFSAGHTELVQFLLAQDDMKRAINLPAISQVTPLMTACTTQNPGLVALLLENGANFLKRNSNGLTALDIAKQEPFDSPDFFQNNKIISLLTQAIQTNKLCIAAKKNDVKTIETLLGAGMDANAVWRERFTALHYAAPMSLKALLTLIKQGGDLYFKATNGKTPLDYVPPEHKPEVLRKFKMEQHKRMLKDRLYSPSHFFMKRQIGVKSGHRH